MKDTLLICDIVNTHGLRGEVRSKVYADDFSYFEKGAKIYVDGVEYESEYAKPHKSFLIIKFSGVDDINQAEKLLKGKKGYINRSDYVLPKDRYFIVDIIGCSVFTEEGKLLGEVTDVFNTGGSDVYEVRDEYGRRFFVPVIDEVVMSIDIDNKRIIIKPMDGMIDYEI